MVLNRIREMISRLHFSLPVLLAAALLVGCGGSSNSSSSSSSGSISATSSTPATTQTSSTATVTTPTSSTATTPTTSTGTSTSPKKSPGGAAGVASCRHGVQSLPHLKQSTKEKLEELCQKADSSDVNAKRKAAEEACEALVSASPLPSGEARDRALAACKNAGRARAKGSIGK
jgi:hypothetical protein